MNSKIQYFCVENKIQFSLFFVQFHQIAVTAHSKPQLLWIVQKLDMYCSSKKNKTWANQKYVTAREFIEF